MGKRVVNNLAASLKDKRVAVTRLRHELSPSIYELSEIRAAICEMSQQLGWAEDGRGCFGAMIAEGSRVVVKPNFVIHFNRGNGGMLPLITNGAVVKAIVSEVLKANPKQVLIGDAPIQSCDLDRLLDENGLQQWSNDLRNTDARFKGILDFRRTTGSFENGVRLAVENKIPLDAFVLFNLGRESLLEPITSERALFRVTSYDPRLMDKTHSLANHQYLVARDIIEADVVINLPKLKTHKKAGITNALKNLVGINGNKEYLPHHRVGSKEEGGDCYPDRSIPKRMLESLLDRQNMTKSPSKARMLASAGTQLERLIRLQGDKIGVEGAWVGNETVARMTLDLNRILYYGTTDAKLDDSVQRRVIHIVDAIVAGQGDGPLASDELPLNLMTAGENAAAVDWVGAHLLGYDAKHIPLLNLAFSQFRWPIAEFLPDQIDLVWDLQEHSSPESLLEFAKRQHVNLPAGWVTAKA